MNATNLVSPNAIDTNKRWYASFDRREREISARLFTKACQASGSSWQTNRAQLNDQDSSGSFTFNGLLNEWIVDCGNGEYKATHRFVCHVFGLFPVK